MRKPAIPDIPPLKDPAVRPVLQAMKENLETIEGRRGGRVDTLPRTATTADIISKVNEILSRLQD